jgi:hypothetical protein
MRRPRLTTTTSSLPTPSSIVVNSTKSSSIFVFSLSRTLRDINRTTLGPLHQLSLHTPYALDVIMPNEEPEKGDKGNRLTLRHTRTGHF